MLQYLFSKTVRPEVTKGHTNGCVRCGKENWSYSRHARPEARDVPLCTSSNEDRSVTKKTGNYRAAPLLISLKPDLIKDILS